MNNLFKKNYFLDYALRNNSMKALHINYILANMKLRDYTKKSIFYIRFQNWIIFSKNVQKSEKD